jgi:hypothetical protein
MLTCIADALGDVKRGLQVVEHAIGVTSHLMGEKLEGMALDTPFHRILMSFQ